MFFFSKKLKSQTLERNRLIYLERRKIIFNNILHKCRDEVKMFLFVLRGSSQKLGKRKRFQAVEFPRSILEISEQTFGILYATINS